MEPAVLSDLSVGAVFAGRYRVERRIAAGGMGAVYEVVHIETNRRRALKVMHAHYVQSDELRARFRQEARVAAEIDSEHIVDVFDAGIDEATGMPFLVMELLRGEEIGKLLKRVGALPKEDVVRYLYETSLALDKTHRVRIVHRDLKPDNLFLCERERGPARVKVLDFGIAKIVSDASTQANATTSMGTPLYMAPEQFVMRGAVSGATDIFALGMIAFTLLVGKPYWYQESKVAGGVMAFVLHVADGPKDSPVTKAWEQFAVELPKAFDVWFFRATARDPGARFTRASEAVIALAEALGVASPEDDVVPKKETLAVPKAVDEPEAEPTTVLLPAMSKSSPSGPVLTVPTQLAMTPMPKADEAALPVQSIRSRSFVFIGMSAVLVVCLGGWFVIKGLASVNAVEPLEPPKQAASAAPIESSTARLEAVASVVVPEPAAPIESSKAVVDAAASVVVPEPAASSLSAPEPEVSAERCSNGAGPAAGCRSVEGECVGKNNRESTGDNYKTSGETSTEFRPLGIIRRSVGHMFRKHWILAGVAVGFSTVTPCAFGQTPDQGKTPAVLFAEALKLRDAGNYVEACPLLEQVHTLDPTERNLFALADCHEHEGKPATALWYFRAYIETYGTLAPNASEKHIWRVDSSKERIDALAVQVPKLKLVWRGEIPSNAKVTVNEVDALGQLNTEWPLDPGEHWVVVERGGHADAPRAVMLESGKPVVEVDLTQPIIEPESEVGNNQAMEPPVIVPETLAKRLPISVAQDNPQRAIGGIAIGAGGVALAIGSVLGGLALVEKSTENRECIAIDTGESCTQAGIAAQNNGRGFAHAAAFPLLVGAALMVTGIVLVLPVKKANAQLRTRVYVNGGGMVTLQGAF
jgi:serine/threonine protein kinase